ncbi:unnamed protein product [Amoebophrya sp. A120]|nr:unnamed protein product [Amoebophrya sp. A120]|eukprot:GSA120T00008413001.1
MFGGATSASSSAASSTRAANRTSGPMNAFPTTSTGAGGGPGGAAGVYLLQTGTGPATSSTSSSAAATSSLSRYQSILDKQNELLQLGNVNPDQDLIEETVYEAVEREFIAYQSDIDFLTTQNQELERFIEKQKERHKEELQTEREKSYSSAKQQFEEIIENQRQQLNRFALEQPQQRQLLQNQERLSNNLQRQLQISEDLRREVSRLEDELELKEYEVRKFDEKSANLEYRVQEAMKAVRRAFAGFQREEDKAKKLIAEKERLVASHEQERTSLLSERASLRKELHRKMKGQKDMVEQLRDLQAPEDTAAKEIRREQDQQALVKILQHQVQSLQAKLVDSLKREQTNTSAISAGGTTSMNNNNTSGIMNTSSHSSFMKALKS